MQDRPNIVFYPLEYEFGDSAYFVCPHLDTLSPYLNLTANLNSEEDLEFYEKNRHNEQTDIRYTFMNRIKLSTQRGRFKRNRKIGIEDRIGRLPLFAEYHELYRKEKY